MESNLKEYHDTYNLVASQICEEELLWRDYSKAGQHSPTFKGQVGN